VHIVASTLRTSVAAASLGYLAAAAWLLWWVLLAAVVPAWTPVVITSGSMAPHIRAGDVVVAAAVAPGDLDVGAVIVFADPVGELTTHRISSTSADGTYRTKGDANAVEDSAHVAADDVVGRGRLLVPAVGRPLVWFTQQQWVPLGTWLLVSIAAGCTVSSWWDRATTSPPIHAASSPAPASPRRPLTAREQQLIAFAWGGVDR
jgi:signal peptidase I